MKTGPRFEVVVACAASTFTLVGLAMRKLGLTKQVIFISVSHFPKPIGWGLGAQLDRLRNWSDKLAQNTCDIVWYQTTRLRNRKYAEGQISNSKITRLLVPIPVDLDGNIEHEVERTTLGYVGRLDNDVGLELALDALHELVTQIPQIKLKIIGSGPLEDNLKEKVKTLNLTANVEFLGFIGDRGVIRSILSRCAACLALYDPELTITMYDSDSAKVKEYMEYGTPIIMTKVPEIAEEIQREKAGFAVEFNKQQLADAMLILLTDDHKRGEYQRNVRRLAVRYDYRKIYGVAFRESNIGWV